MQREFGLKGYFVIFFIINDKNSNENRVDIIWK